MEGGKRGGRDDEAGVKEGETGERKEKKWVGLGWGGWSGPRALVPMGGASGGGGAGEGGGGR